LSASPFSSFADKTGHHRVEKPICPIAAQALIALMSDAALRLADRAGGG
jgi:hypothetical protein